MTLFVASSEITIKCDAAGNSTTDAAVALERITQDAREALWCALPDDGHANFTPPSGAAASAFETVVSGTTDDTGLELSLPGTKTVSVQSGTSLSTAIYDRADPSPAGDTLWFYRSDSNGAPDSQAGTCLWMCGNERGTVVSRALLTDIGSAPGALRFNRPVTAAGVPLPYQVQIKIVSASYSLIVGSQSNETTDGTVVTATAGKCVLLRDHEPGLDHEPTPAASGGSNAFLSN